MQLLSVSGCGRRLELGSGWNGPGLADNLEKILAQISSTGKESGPLTFSENGLDRHDALVASSILEIIRAAQAQGLEVQFETLPDSIRKLIGLALAVPPREPESHQRDNLFTVIGKKSLRILQGSRHFFEFAGELTYSFGRLVRGKARFRREDFWLTLQSCGVGALPIVALISILVGVILGFVGAVQLRKFGATIYMIDLVGLAVARELGCIMAGIIMSGRTGAAFAAQIGSMNVNQEVDALETLGISPMEFLVLPRALSMILMMPLLTLFADALGFFGGFIVALPMGISPGEFWYQLTESLSLQHISIGILKSFFFGIIVASAGCYYGLRSGRSSSAVGEAATKAVVAGITWIIVLDAAFAFVLEAMGW